MRFSSAACAAALVLSAAQGVVAFNKQAIDAFKRVQRHPVREPAAVQADRPRINRRDSPYLNEKTQKFVVNGSAIPNVPFNVGESYAGLMPISDAPDESRQLFFWFFPSTNPEASDEITIWLNGGPGCSSLSGLLTENGPFTWEAGTLAPVQNPYTWVNLTNMIWVEQPVGVGFSQGVPNITNEVELGLEFIGFYKQFVDAFQVHKRKVYITGESYAGYYVPYIADAFITANDTDYYNLAGVAINDPIIGDGNIQQEVIISPYVDYWSNLFNLNETFMNDLHQMHAKCGYEDYIAKYFTFPAPQEPFPPAPNGNGECDVLDWVYSAALEVNPCFNIYHITETCPHPYGVLGIVNDGDYSPPGAQVYFNRSDVQAAINAPVGTQWYQCTPKNVFGGGSTTNFSAGDTSVGPAPAGVLQRVIEYTNNTVIGSGNLDFLLATNGTLFVLQNTTWHGHRGFQEFPGKDFFVPYHDDYNGGALGEAGVVGKYGTERGLTFYQVQLAGHELPGYTPASGYRMLEFLLGRVSSLGDTSPFTTQRNSSGAASPTKFRQHLPMREDIHY